MFPGDSWMWVARLVLAAIVGALIGGERETHGHPAGVRTQSPVALAAALLTGAGKEGFLGQSVDFSRVASQVVTGIGFIGAGVILKNRGTVTGLTTAATLFLSAGLGVAIGADLLFPAAVTTAIALIVIYGLRWVKPFLRRRVARRVEVDHIQRHGTFGPLLRSVQAGGASVQDLRVDDEKGADGRSLRHVSIQVVAKRDVDIEDRLADLRSRPEVKAIRVIDS